MAEARHNFDNPAISTGIAAGDIFADFETQLIANRSVVFQRAKQTPDFRMGVINQYRAFQEANAAAAQKTMTEALNLASGEVRKAYQAGQALTDKAIEHYNKQGAGLTLAGTVGGAVLINALSSIFGAFFGYMQYSRMAADRQLTTIANLVNPAADNIDAEIDRVQMPFLKLGIPASSSINGQERELAGVAEYETRNATFETLTAAEGERAQQYNIPLMLISSHPSSCPLCSPWQSKILVNDLFAGATPDGKHELASTAKAAGLWHYNCRHSYVPYIEGFDNPDLFAHDKASPKKTAEIYAVEQEQRYNERTIREWKRREVGAMSEAEKLNAGRKVEEWQARQRALRDVAKQRDIPFYRQYSREQIGGATKPTLPWFINR
jgi:hypothetical protein